MKYCRIFFHSWNEVLQSFLSQLTKKLNSKKKRDKNAEGDTDEKGTQADLDNGIIIPPLPFDMEVVEKLLQDTAVKPLDSRWDFFFNLVCKQVM